MNYPLYLIEAESFLNTRHNDPFYFVTKNKTGKKHDCDTYNILESGLVPPKTMVTSIGLSFSKYARLDEALDTLQDQKQTWQQRRDNQYEQKKIDRYDKRLIVIEDFIIALEDQLEDTTG